MIEKVVLGRRFFKSLFLISNYSKYDCEMTLFFIERNVHFNFKSETNIFDYFSECSLASIKNVSLVKDTSMSRQMLIFNQLGIYFFYSILASIVASAFYFLVRVYAETQDATPFIVRVNQWIKIEKNTTTTTTLLNISKKSIIHFSSFSAILFRISV